MITLKSVGWVHEGWEIRFVTKEGVYHLKDYPVRISHLAYTEDSDLRDALAAVAKGLLHRHMRSGSVSPHGMVLNWSRAERICKGGNHEMMVACHMIEASTLAKVGAAVSNHF